MSNVTHMLHDGDRQYQVQEIYDPERRDQSCRYSMNSPYLYGTGKHLVQQTRPQDTKRRFQWQLEYNSILQSTIPAAIPTIL